jgi:hypothetical protein
MVGQTTLSSEEEPMLRSSLILHRSAHKEGIHADVLGEIMPHWVTRNADSACTV